MRSLALDRSYQEGAVLSAYQAIAKIVDKPS
jgi:monoamine oxidase